jgi:hypothetical protein
MQRFPQIRSIDNISGDFDLPAKISLGDLHTGFFAAPRFFIPSSYPVT